MKKRREGEDPLAVKIIGNDRELSLKNPILTASGTFGFGLEYEPYGDLNTLGGFVAKGVSLKARDGNPMPRIAETPAGMLNAIGLQNPGVSSFIKDILPKIKNYDTSIIANLYATSVEDFAELASILSTEGIAALEVNVSCPNVKEGGAAFGQDPLMVAKVTKAVAEASDLPVIVKLSPNVTDIAEIAKACEGAGATALSCINTLMGMGIDLKTRKPLLSTVIGGLSGPAIKAVGLRAVWQVSQAVDIPVIGVGGIVTVYDALEYILAGAHAVQLGTVNFLRPDAAFAMVDELPKAMEELGIDNLDSFRGTLDISLA